jgi:hypothetical protein
MAGFSTGQGTLAVRTPAAQSLFQDAMLLANWISR